MAYIFDPESKNIAMSAGDTFTVKVNAKRGRYDVAIFAIYDRKTHVDVVKIVQELAENDVTKIRIANRHTRDVDEGVYKWNVRLVSDPEYDKDGNIIVDDDSDNVYTVFGPESDKIPNCTIRRTGAYV